MTRSCLALLLAAASAAAAGEFVIDDFEGPVRWAHHADGGARVQARRDTEHAKAGKAALRLTYADAPPHWSNLHKAISVPPNAAAVALWLRVHAAQPKAAMHLWLFEPDGDGWVIRMPVGRRGLAELAPGWHHVVVPVAAFRFQPRGKRTRQMTTADEMLIGCNFADLDVTIDHLRFILREERVVSEMPRTENLRFEDGETGRLAILADELPGSAGAASPERVAAVARAMGFGVTLLKAGDACDAAILNRENVGVFVVPCAPAYPREGRGALLGFLKAGGSLVSIGGYAFDRQVVYSAEGWSEFDPTLTAQDMDKERPAPESINTRYGRPGDTMRLGPDQVGAFDPSYLLEHVAYAATAPDQAVLKHAVRLEGELEGFAACAMTGSNSPVFPRVYGRWTPLLNAHDSLGRLRGAAASVVHHWAGPFAGSSWALFGVTNRDLTAGDAGAALLRSALRAVAEKTFLHGLRTQWACYRQGEVVRATVQVTNHGRAPRNLAVRFGGGKLEAVERRLAVAPGQTRSVEAAVHPGAFDRDYYVVEAKLLDADSGEALDQMATAFVVWDEKVVRAGPTIALKDNYFTWNGEPRFLCGSNQTGMMWYSEHENPLVWERDFATMQANGLRMLRILHFSPFAADEPTRWGEQGVFVLRNRPEKLLRQTDAIVQLAQKHGVAVFLALHDWMPVELSDAKLEAQREWNGFWAERYRDVPGILYDVQNEPGVGLSEKPDLVRLYNAWLKARYGTWDALRNAWGAQAPQGGPWTLKPAAGSDDWADVKTLDANRFRVETLNRWVKANVEGVRQADPAALVTVGYLQMFWPADRVLGARHVDFSNMHYHAPVDPFPAQFKFIDRRLAGKSFSLGEFGAVEAHGARNRGQTGTMPEASVRRFLTVAHYAFGLGASLVLNWDWKDFDDCVFPWGLCHPCDLVPKPVLVAYRNASLFLERLRPRYSDPGLWLLLPDSHRLGARTREVHDAIFRTIEALIASHVDFGVANEEDLGEQPATCRAIVWPVPYCPDDAAFEWVLTFVRNGGALYLSGDVAYDPLRRRTQVARLAALGLTDVGERRPFSDGWQKGQHDVQRATVGKGKVFYEPDPIELAGGPVRGRLRGFLAYAGIERIAVEPDHPRLHVFTQPLADGSATIVCNRTGGERAVKLRDAELVVGESLTGLVATTAGGAVTQIECTGRSAVGGKPITSGDAHAMVASLDGRDVRESGRLVVFPITEGRLAIHTAAKWRSPVLEAGELDGPAWRTLATRPLRVEEGKLSLAIDDTLARAILIVRESEAAPGLR